MSEGFSKGLQIRRQVMGGDFVDQAYANASDFTRPLQDFITEHAWGTVWQRPGLDVKIRSLATVAMLTALGRTHELAGHVRGALRNGASAGEIQEILLHSAIYCGVPLAAEAFRCAEKVISQYQAESASP